MTVGERIKERRKELGLSVDQVADLLNKNRATIYRYESDEIENLSINVLEPLALALRTSPGYLMGWEVNDKQTTIVKEDIIEYGEGKDLLNRLTSYFLLLNNTGKEEAIKRIQELTFIPMYCKSGGE